MQWSDSGIVLSVRKHGEANAIVSLLTESRGRHLGLVRGGAGRRLRGVLQPGNDVAAEWRARLPEHLGTMTVELSKARAAHILDDPDRLAGLSAACALCEAVMPERERHRPIYYALGVLLDNLQHGEEWPAVYARFELGLLQEQGFGLDLSRCAATGTTDDLVFVSPKSGRAVSRSAGEPYRDRLLALPAFLLGSQAGNVSGGDIRDALRLTGYFLEQHLFAPHDRRLPAARSRLEVRITSLAEADGDTIRP